MQYTSIYYIILHLYNIFETINLCQHALTHILPRFNMCCDSSRPGAHFHGPGGSWNLLQFAGWQLRVPVAVPWGSWSGIGRFAARQLCHACGYVSCGGDNQSWGLQGVFGHSVTGQIKRELSLSLSNWKLITCKTNIHNYCVYVNYIHNVWYMHMHMYISIYIIYNVHYIYIYTYYICIWLL